MKKRIILIALAGVILAGCATVDKRLELFHSVREMVVRQRYEEAIATISGEEKDILYNKKSEVVFLLDMGFLHHYAGNYEESNEYLTQAEYRIEELYTESISDIAASLLTNDNALQYAGEDYEDLYTNIIKAINFIKLNSFDGAFVEINRLNNKLNLLEDKYKKLAEKYNKSGKMVDEIDTQSVNFYSSAMGRYLSHLIYYTEGQYGDAELDLKKIDEAFETQKAYYDFKQPNLTLDEETTDVKVSVLCYGGPSPVKDYTTYRIKSAGNLIIIIKESTSQSGQKSTERVGTFPFPGVGDNFYTKIEVPRMVKRNSRIASIRVAVDGGDAGSVQLFESVNNIAIGTFKIKESLIYLKTITRAMVKGVGSAAASSAIERASGSGALGFLSGLVFGAATEVSEKADVRISRFLPARFYVKEMYLPPGQHSISVEYLNDAGNVLYTHYIEDYEVTDNKVNLVSSYYLD